ncbi:hypothetical protein E2562_026139 [Oryza meyeriana var. granulata]|uniref:Uncharacterized protein n=1 Tax=Oryza meyeriana var. granulata TaxID=110450 RepID=A0A6G1FCJ6_9ORYZ|nr:hypothetical protein E2562_026139 [Oryza meyeriana var. granulata]
MSEKTGDREEPDAEGDDGGGASSAGVWISNLALRCRRIGHSYESMPLDLCTIAPPRLTAPPSSRVGTDTGVRIGAERMTPWDDDG